MPDAARMPLAPRGQHKSFLIRRFGGGEDAREEAGSAANSNNGAPKSRFSIRAPSINLKKLTRVFGNTFMSSLSAVGVLAPNPSTVIDKSKIRYMCVFEDEVLRVPGCHGNCILRLDFMDEERKLASYQFNMNKEGRMMFWGGEFARPAKMTEQRRGSNKVKTDDIDPPVIEFELRSGAAGKSR